jgi:pimeloyl-ACP methyl ester carboxylesterase
MAPTPFTVRVSDETLADLRDRLSRARWPDEIPDSTWQYGTSLEYLKELVGYWRDTFDWRAQEAKLNQFQQFTAPIGGIDLHFIHQPGVGPNPMPLLVGHGWPGSVWEFHKLIPLLTDPARFGGDPADAFTVVAPSLPGYAFSFTPGQPRFDRVQMADAFARLMTDELGYRRFGVQGGDIGSQVAARMATAYPERLTGLHLNFLSRLPPPQRPHGPSDAEARYAAELEEFVREGSGYQWIQGTRPQTLAYGLTDSPVGLAAWIVEKFRAWSDCDGDVERRFSKDEILTDVMLYWVTGAINSSFWPYYSARHGDWVVTDSAPISVPTAYLALPREIVRPPRSMAEEVFNIQRWTELPSGGHFAALEEPEALAADLRAFFRDRRA